ncbi:hypothetical protein [Catellatospora citrea]|uniref:Uncharacterized protein n=1 Tax=Catellatospora citrea TaxID=53366 RepID=A0A8J3P273_9ACTN|nr:hypothetical protein [Catellatospora citrea]RKE08852.1 hypothetical protein C8E86_3726 [Catellatospora citrea]GIG01276.1 hypothetical protein Cci01nite_63690 [Catellatospora citrea]
MSLHGQLDLFTGATVDRPAPPAVVRRAVKALLEPGQVRYASFGGKRDCDDCWQAQADANAAGKPVPLRRRATSSRETTGGKAYLCELHKLDRQSTDKEVEV